MTLRVQRLRKISHTFHVLPMDYTTLEGEFTKDFDPRVIPPTRARDIHIHAEKPVPFWSLNNLL